MEPKTSTNEKGSVLIVTMVGLTALLGIAGMTILSARSTLSTSASNRFQTSALFAAESGVWAGIDFLRQSCDQSTLFTQFVSPDNASPQSPSGIFANNVPPGTAPNPFDIRRKAWYRVTILNNSGDPGLSSGRDTDSQVILHVVGYGPDGTQATVEVEVRNDVCLAKFCDADYAQRGLTALNTSAFGEDNPCATDVNDDTTTRSIDP